MSVEKPRGDLRRRLKAVKPGASIQSKLMLMLLGVSLVSAVVVGLIGFLNGRDSLRDAAFDQLTSLRELRAEQIERTFQGFEEAAILDSRNPTAAAASAAFNEGFAELEDSVISPADAASLEAYYADTFIPQLEERSEASYQAASFSPDNPATQYLQQRYTATAEDFDAAIAVDDAGDGSDWSAAHAEYHDYFRGLVENLGYEDVLLLNTDGDVVYSAYKGVDLGLNLFDGPLKDSSLSAAYLEVLRTNTVDTVATVDFERYYPSLNVPTSWVISPIGVDGSIIGALAVQIPVDTVNSVMTGDQRWVEQGLGETGEVYIVGADGSMRSLSRALIEDPDAFRAGVISAGTEPALADRIIAVDGTVLLQRIDSDGVIRALRGETGTLVDRDYLGNEVLTAYAPLDIHGVRWVILAQVDSAEAFAPVNDFARTMILSTAAIVLIISLLSLLLAQVFTRPLRRLLAAVRRVSAGERDVQVDTQSTDEVADVGAAFNDMSRSLQVKADLLEEQKAENERLLLTLMPESVAQRYRQGDETIAEDHQDVTVIYADIMGFDELRASLSSDAGLAILNDVLRSFDTAAERYGVERVRTTTQGYLASCGLVVPRVDGTRRVVEFALELDGILSRVGSQHGTPLTLRAGIDSGTVTSGLVGRSSVVYDLWGDAVKLAYQLQSAGRGSGIYVSQRVIDKLPGKQNYTESGVVETSQGPQRIWLLDAGAARV